MVAKLLGREPMGRFSVAIRRDDGSPVVLENAPLMDDGRPMPTRFWLADKALNRAVGTLESSGAIDRIEAELGLDVIAEIHQRYGDERDSLIASTHEGPRPSGGVGGTRVGVKCLHAHYANFLVTGADVVGQWVDDTLRSRGQHFDASVTGLASEPEAQ